MKRRAFIKNTAVGASGLMLLPSSLSAMSTVLTQWEFKNRSRI